MQPQPSVNPRYTLGPPPPPPPPSGPQAGNTEAIRRHLTSHSWPTGLQNVLISGLQTTPARFIICDDSGSMTIGDGHKIFGEGTQSK